MQFGRSYIFLLLIHCVVTFDLCAQKFKISDIIKKDSLLQAVFNNPAYEVQIIYTEINRDKKNNPEYKDYHLTDNRYFYPAQTVKLPAAVFTLEKINTLKQYKIDKFTPIQINADYPGRSYFGYDFTSTSGLASFGHLIRRMFLIQDSDAYNRCYDFLGQRYFNERMHSSGFKNSWFLMRLDSDYNTDAARHTNSVLFIRTDSTVYYKDNLLSKIWPSKAMVAIYTQPSTYNTSDYYAGRPKIVKGEGKSDFTDNNFLPLSEIHEFLKSVIFPDTKNAKYNLYPEDYNFLYRYMSMYPSESKEPLYGNIYPDNFAKYILKDSTNNSGIRVFNNSGKGYGYIIESAYFADYVNNIEFFLSVSLNCNPSGIFSEKNYEYDKGKNFIANLGELIRRHEINRNKKKIPDLSKFSPYR